MSTLEPSFWVHSWQLPLRFVPRGRYCVFRVTVGSVGRSVGRRHSQMTPAALNRVLTAVALLSCISMGRNRTGRCARRPVMLISDEKLVSDGFMTLVWRWQLKTARASFQPSRCLFILSSPRSSAPNNGVIPDATTAQPRSRGLPTRMVSDPVPLLTPTFLLFSPMRVAPPPNDRYISLNKVAMRGPHSNQIRLAPGPAKHHRLIINSEHQSPSLNSLRR